MTWPADCEWGFKKNMSKTTKVYAMRCYATRSFGMDEDATKRGG
jgi:hypothetical protein